MDDGTWRIEVDRDLCVGTGLCTDAMPDCFRIEGGRAMVTRETVAPDDEFREVVEACPTEAVAVHDARTGRRIAPAP